jgi:mRNA-degrading endonuclease toxin of MazEF toxin-antitoxin module
MYKRGDVVTLEFPYKENRTITKPRPVVILETFVKDECYVCKVTKTNRTGQLSGRWVLKESEEGKLMGIDYD